MVIQTAFTFEKVGPEFFNTIHLSGSELTAAKGQTGLQDRRIIGLFEFWDCKMTPFELHEHYENQFGRTPITSIRRSITVLTRRGKLEKLSEMKLEREGKVNHYWRLV